MGGGDIPEDIDLRDNVPRATDDILDIKTLSALFPHLSKERLQRLIPLCETYREKAYSTGYLPGEDANDSHW